MSSLQTSLRSPRVKQESSLVNAGSKAKEGTKKNNLVSNKQTRVECIVLIST